MNTVSAAKHRAHKNSLSGYELKFRDFNVMNYFGEIEFTGNIT